MDLKIQQHYFTRSSEGLFSGTEGYDSVAKSLGLEKKFIKNHLFPFCTYESPLIGFFTDDGQMVLSKNSEFFDHISNRNTLFVHQYIIPSNLAADLARKPSSIFQADGFETTYTPSVRKILPEITEVPFEEQQISMGSLIQKLGINDEQFKKIIHAVMKTVLTKKLLFLSFDLDKAELQKYSKMLLEVIFQCLPLSFRMKVGFDTYRNEIKRNQLINITFLERGILGERTGSTNDFIFDFKMDSFENIDQLETESKYLKLVTEQLQNSIELNQFHHFVEETIEDKEEKEKLSIELYDELAHQYLLLKNNPETIDVSESSSIYKMLRSHLSIQNVQTKKGLYHLLTKTITSDKNRASHHHEALTEDIIEQLIHYYDLLNAESQKDVCIAIIFSMKNSRDRHYIQGVYTKLIKKKMLFDRIIVNIKQNERLYEMLLIDYLEMIVNSTRSNSKLIEEIGTWIERVPYLVEENKVNDAFWDYVRKKLLVSLKESTVIEETKTIFKKLNNSVIDPNYRDKYEELIDTVLLPPVLDKCITLLQLNTMTKKDFLSLGEFLKVKSVKSSLKHMESEKNHFKLKTIDLLIDFYHPDFSFELNPPNRYYLKHFNDKKGATEYQKLLKRLLVDEIQLLVDEKKQPMYFSKVLFAFYNIDHLFGDRVRPELATSSEQLQENKHTTNYNKESSLRNYLVVHDESDLIDNTEKQSLSSRNLPRKSFNGGYPDPLDSNYESQNEEIFQCENRMEDRKDISQNRISEYNYFDAFVFILHQNLKNSNDSQSKKQRVYDFIEWLCKKNSFVYQSPSKRMLEVNFEQALERYFIEIDPEALKNRQVMSRFKTIESLGLLRSLKKMKIQSATGVMKVVYQTIGSIKPEDKRKRPRK